MSESGKLPEAYNESIEKILNILKHKGRTSYKLAKEAILSDNIQSKEVYEAFYYYAENFLEFTPSALMVLACEAVGGESEKTALVGAAITLFVGAMDIHDDIIDQSKIKDGRQTLFGKFGKEIALLVGDALLIKGFTLFQKASYIIQREEMIRTMNILQKAFFEVGDAHALEIYLKGNVNVSPEDYLRLVSMKSAGVEAYTKIGALLGRGSQKEIELLGKYGRRWAMLSKIRNDFADLFEPEELKNRMQNEILPLPLLYVFKDSAIKKEIIRILSNKHLSQNDIETITDIVFESEHVNTLKEYMKNLVDEAICYISYLRDSDAKKVLIEFIQLMLESII